nr:hypothetical protein [Actinomycetota bacterium]
MQGIQRLALLLVVCVLGALPAARPGEAAPPREVTVVRVLSGDTFLVRSPGTSARRVRLLGVNAPALGACYGRSARSIAERLVGGKRVLLHGTRRLSGVAHASVIL